MLDMLDQAGPLEKSLPSAPWAPPAESLPTICCFCLGCNGGSVVFLSVHMRRLGCHVGSSAMKRNPGLSEQSSVFAERARRVAVVGRAVSCVLRVHAAVRCFGHTVEFNHPSVMRCA